MSQECSCTHRVVGIYGGGGSNHTLARILEESILIEMYRNCHVMVENAFHLEHRTTKHSPSDMTRTLQKLAGEIQQSHTHIFTPGRTAKYSVLDNIEIGVDGLQWQTNKLGSLNEIVAGQESYQPAVEPEDLDVE